MIKSRFINILPTVVCCFLFLVLGHVNAVAVNPPGVNCHCVIKISGSNSCDGVKSGKATATAYDGTSPYTYRWSNGATGATITGLASGTYRVTSTDKQGCTATQSVTISSVNVNVNAGADKTICRGSSVQMGASGATIYKWSPATGLSNPNIANPVASPTVTTTYTVTGGVPSGELVTNGNFESGNTGFTSEYNFHSDLYPEGRYNVGNNANNYHGNFFGTGRGGSGKFMIINGATVAGVEVWRQNVNVNPNTTYYFSTWITALNNLVSANLAFSVNGVLMGPVISSPSSPNNWVQFYAVWNSGSATTARISIVNQNTIANGNDFGLDDISFTTVCEDSDQVVVFVNNATANAGPDQTLCEGLPATLTATGGGTYKWSTGATTASITVTSNTTQTYTVTVTNNGCTATDDVKINRVKSGLGVKGTITQPTCTSVTGSITLAPYGGTTPYTYSWSNGATTKDISNLGAGTYTVTVTDKFGCKATYSGTIVVPATFTVTATTVDPNCFGGTGSIDATVNGGTSPYTYKWSNNATTQDLTNVAAGTYTLTVTDARGCTATVSKTLTAPAALSVSANAVDPGCAGGNTGTITLTVSGGTTAYSFRWSNGATTQNLSNLGSGTYTVTVTDAKGCTATASKTISAPSALSANIASTPVSCIGGTDGTATVTPSGGTSPYTYSWSNGRTTAAITGLGVGSYSVTVTDAKGCTVAKTVSVTGVPPLTIGSVPSPVLCSGGNTGSINATISGGTPGYTYKWSTGATTEDISGVAAGTYTLTVTDSKGCVATASVTVSQPNPISASAVPTHVNCNGGSTGKVTLTVSGGTSPYTYKWNTNATSKDLNNVTAGTYTVTVTDANNCTALANATVTQKDSLKIVTTETHIGCNGQSTGSITTTVSGGTTPYTYLWSSGATTANLSNLAAGMYTLTVTDANGCKGIDTSGIVQRDSIQIIVDTIVHNKCYGDSSGSATIRIIGGTPTCTPGTYTGPACTGCTQTLSGNGNATITAGMKVCVLVGQTFTGSINMSGGELIVCGILSPSNFSTTGGVITVNGTLNANVINLSSGVTINNYGVINVNTNITGSGTLNNYGAVNVSADLNVHSGGTLNNFGTISVSNSLNVTGTAVNNGTVAISNNLQINGGGKYTNNCKTTTSGNFLNNSLFYNNGQLLVGATSYINGGSVLNLGVGASFITRNIIVNAQINGPVSHCALVKITGLAIFNGGGLIDGKISLCILNQLLNLNLNLNILGLNINTTCAACTAVPPTSATSYTIRWSTGDTTRTVSGLPAGTYTVTVTDASGCSATKSVTVTQPDSLTATINKTDVSCSANCDGTASLTNVGGGTPPYTYKWSNNATTQNVTNLCGGTYTVTITDKNGCKLVKSVTVGARPKLKVTATPTPVNCFAGSTGAVTTSVTGGTSPFTYAWTPGGATTANLTNRPAGSYTVIVTDANGCKDTATAVITQPADSLNGTTNSTPVSCIGGTDGTASVTATGGTAPYTYVWSTSPARTTAAITGLRVGSYTVTVTDAKGCTIVRTVNVTGVAPLTIGSVPSPVLCNGGNTGSINLTISGGTPSYTFLWSNGATTEDISGLTAGTYNVTVTDSKGCVATAGVSVSQPQPLVATATPVNIACFGGNTGGVNVSVVGGTSPFTYAWSNGATTRDITGLTAGTYTVTVTDKNGCKDIVSATVTAQPSLVISTNPTHVTCFGLNNGSVTTSVNGGVAPYTYNWGSGIGTANRTNLAPGTYTVTVTDANNCTGTATATVTQPADSLNGTTNSTPVSCIGGTDGTASVTATGGTAPYTYVWSTTPARTTAAITGLRAGNYSVTITDAKGCSIVRTVTVTTVPALTVGAVPSPVLCFDGATGSVNATVSGGTPGYTFLWSNGAITEDISNVPTGTYSLTVTDSKGCVATASVTVQQPQALVATATPTTIPCLGANSGSVTVSVVGGTSPFAYAWSNGATTRDLSGLAAGTYTLTVTDKNGCKDTVAATVTAQPTLAVDAVGTNLTCYNNNSGTATANVTGGLAPYTFRWSTTPARTTQTINGLTVGTYAVTVTDANGCTATDNVVLTQPDTLEALASCGALLCYGDKNSSITLLVMGGTAPYTYIWSTGATTRDLANMGAGTYTVTITDAKGCTATEDAIVNQPAELIATANPLHIACNGAATGGVNLTVVGGKTPYTFIWSNGATTQNLTGLTAGTYTVTVTDQNGCKDTVSTTITQQSQLQVTATPTHIPCFGQNNGSVTTSVNGGVAPYTYNWGGGVTTANRTGLAPGTYTVTVTDANNCTGTATATVTQPTDSLNGITNSTPVSCIGGTDGTASVTASGGTGPYTYVWSTTPARTTAALTGLRVGSYTVTVTDAKGCTIVRTVQVTGVPPLTIGSLPSPVLCNGGNTGSINVTISGGTPGYTFLWSNGATTEDISGLVAGTYNVTVTDSKGCIATAGVSVTQPQPLQATATPQHIACFGATNGGVNLSVVGGTSPFTYAWSNAATTRDIAGVAAGTYTVTVTDKNGCTATATATITQQLALQVTLTPTDVTCFGFANGSITSAVNGGVAPYTYNWGAGQPTTANRSNLAPATYNVTVTDANGCTGTATATITQPSATLAASIVKTDINCYGEQTGAADLTVTGGTAPYTYSWNGGATTEDRTGLAAGTYTVTVTDAKGCTATATTTLTQPNAELKASATKTDVNCFGGNNGTVTLTVSGGTTAYSYLWSNGATTQNLTGLTAGTYTVTVTDAKGCTATASATVTQPSAALNASANKTDVNCFGGNNGTVTLTVSGGTTAYTFLWSNGAITQNLTALVAGTYTVTVTDAKGCTATASATVGQPADSLNGTTNSTPVSCIGGTDGTASVTASGGTAPYTYVWSTTPARTTAALTGLRVGSYTVTVTDAKGCTIVRTVQVTGVPALTVGGLPSPVLCNAGNTGSINLTVNGGTPGYTFVWSNGATTEDITGLTAGTYNVTVTDAKGCVATAGFTVQQPQPLQATATPQHIACFGGNTGGVTLSVNGGTTPFTYAWSNGAVTRDITGLTAGTYTVTVTDKNGCTATANATITQQPNLVVDVTGSNLGCYANNSGTATANVIGGLAPYTFRWNNNATTQTINGLTIGTYAVTVTDANGCTGTGSVVVTQPDSLEALASCNALSCYGDSTNITLLVIGGTAPYTYLWSNGATTRNLANQVAGTYTVTVTDANGCIITASATVSQPDLLVATATPLHIACNGAATGGVNLSVVGGTAPYTYAWSNGAATQNLSGLIAGTYTVTVTDAKGCKDIVSATINQQSQLQIAATPTHIPCFGQNNGTVTTSVNGGVAPYTYNWGAGQPTTANRTGLAPGTYTVTVTDANNCTGTATATVTQPTDSLNGITNSTPVSCIGGTDGTASVTATGGTAPYTYLWSTTPARTTAALTGLRVGSYTVTITDAKGCTVVRTVTVTGVPPLTIGSVPSPVLCNGGNTGSINLTVSGGTPGYTFLWSNGATTEDISGLVAGSYNVTVTDRNGCVSTSGVTVQQPQPLVATPTAQHIACFGATNGGVSLSVVGGTTPFTYAWSNGATSQNITGVVAGTYTVTVTDKNGCTATASATVNQQAALQVTVTPTNLTCNGNNTGALVTTVNGGVAPYTYTWGAGQPTTANRTGLPIGTYNVTVTDANGCTGTGTATITQPAVLTASATGSAVLCFGNQTGTVDLTVNGGTTAYTYLWSNGATTEDLSGLAAGTYTATVTDANGCTATASATVTQPAALTANATGSALLCNGNQNGTATLTVTGGTAPFTYAWSNGTATQNLSGLVAGTYTVTVTDANGCSATGSASVTQPALLVVSGISTNVLCNGGDNADITLTVVGGTAPFTYAWSNGAATQNLADITAGTYTVTVTDANGCTDTESFTIAEPAVLTASATPQHVRCFLGADGSISVTVSGGTAPYTYRWNTNATTQNLTALRAGTYTVTVTDANDCSTIVTATVTQPGPLTLGGVPSPVSCSGGSNGSINLTVTGGVAPYVYAWGTGATTEDISGLIAGTYNVTVTDANNCVATVAVTVQQPQPISLGFATTNVTTNGGSNGAIDLSVVGGTSPFTYRWSNGATTQDLTGIPAGNYCVTVTDVNGCTATDCRTITEPACTGFTANAVGTNVGCNGGSNGTATVTITGGVAPYSFNWGAGQPTTQNRTGLAAGTYIVTITDGVNCSATASVTITQPATLTAGAVGTNPACNGQSNGSIALTVNGGTAPYTYLWSNGATTQNLTGLAGNAYTVTVTDANGCTATANATLVTPGALAVSNQVTNVRCFLGADGSISTAVTGGTAPFTYRWSNNATTANITALRAGTFTVTVTDAKGCTATRTLTVTQPGPLTLGGVPTPVSCFGGNDGAINLTVSGGTAPYRYAWSNGATIEDISGLAAGAYNVTVTDANNCVATVSVNVQQPSAIALSANVTDACAGGNSGAIQLNVVGGTSPFTYRWSNNAVTKNIGSLAPGAYAVTVTDSKGCTATNSFNVGSNVNCRTMEFTVNVMLEGPFEQSNMMMHNKLRTQCNTVPLFQPYGGGAANRGTESVASLDNDVVDWVLVSFRTGTDRTTEVHKVAGLLTTSGKVKTITGDTLFQLNSSPSDSLFIVVEHRNHMGVMTPVKMCPSHATNGVICVDFTRTQSYTSGTPATAGQKLLGTDSRGPIYGMHSGDADGNFDINSSDFVPFGTDFNKFDIYSPGDFNMDCDCNSNDLPKWLDNFNQFSGVR